MVPAVLNWATPPERANRLSLDPKAFCLTLGETTASLGVRADSELLSGMLLPTKNFSFSVCGFYVTRYIGTSVLVGGNWTCAFNVRHELLQRHFLLQQFQLSFEFPYLLGKCHSFLNFWLSYRKEGVQELTSVICTACTMPRVNVIRKPDSTGRTTLTESTPVPTCTGGINPKFEPREHEQTSMVLFTKNPLQFQCPKCNRLKQRIDVPISDYDEGMKSLAKKLGWLQ